MTPRERVLEVVEAGRRIADPRDPIGVMARRQLLQAAQLSEAGIELALTEHLETTPSDADIDRLLESVQPAPRCHVILAANVCTAALRAIATAVATSDAVFIKPSRRDPVVAELLIATLAWPHLTVVSELRATEGDAVHVYGSDETIAAVRASLPPRIVWSAHGTGLGVAVVSADDDIAEAARAITRDLIPFDGRGCLSPRLVVSEVDPLPLARALHASLLELGEQVPRGALDEAERAALRHSCDIFNAVGNVLEGPHHALFVDPAPEAIELAPACRAAVVIRGGALLPSIARHVAAVGCNRGTRFSEEIVAICQGARWSLLGHMQRPPLDGPVDRRGSLLDPTPARDSH
jgi:hypothetical protein